MSASANTRIVRIDHTPRIILHGGVADDPDRSYRSALATLRETVQIGHKMLSDGASSLDVVQECVQLLEASGEFAAGQGAVPNAEGIFALDASIMDGSTGRGAGVGAVRSAKTAIPLARRVLEKTNETLIVGDAVKVACGGDESLFTHAPEDYYRPILTGAEIVRWPCSSSAVGAASFDRRGRAAAATAACGSSQALSGRIGETPVLGAGTWADLDVAVSCAGQGEYFLRCCAAREVSTRMRMCDESPREASEAVIKEVEELGGLGGLITATAAGVAWAFNTFGLKRAWIDSDGFVHDAVT